MPTTGRGGGGGGCFYPPLHVLGAGGAYSLLQAPAEGGRRWGGGGRVDLLLATHNVEVSLYTQPSWFYIFRSWGAQKHQSDHNLHTANMKVAQY